MDISDDAAPGGWPDTEMVGNVADATKESSEMESDDRGDDAAATDLIYPPVGWPEALPARRGRRAGRRYRFWRRLGLLARRSVDRTD